MSILAHLADLEQNGEAAALATVVRARGSVPRHPGSKMLVFGDGRIEGTIGGGEMEARVVEEALRSLQDGGSRLVHYELVNPKDGDPGVCGGEVEVFVEPIGSRPTLVIVGGGHVGQAVVHLARWLGFRTVVSDDRPEYASPETLPEADVHIVCALAELPKRMTIDSQTYIVLTTRGVAVDVDGLPALLETPAAFIGVIGSRRRWETAAQQLAECGLPADRIARIVSPMGLELNAETPEEIAVSILSQIIMLRRGGTGESMRHEVGPRRASKGA